MQPPKYCSVDCVGCLLLCLANQNVGTASSYIAPEKAYVYHRSTRLFDQIDHRALMQLLNILLFSIPISRIVL